MIHCFTIYIMHGSLHHEVYFFLIFLIFYNIYEMMRCGYEYLFIGFYVINFIYLVLCYKFYLSDLMFKIFFYSNKIVRI